MQQAADKVPTCVHARVVGVLLVGAPAPGGPHVQLAQQQGSRRQLGLLLVQLQSLRQLLLGGPMGGASPQCLQPLTQQADVGSRQVAGASVGHTPLAGPSPRGGRVGR